MPGKPVILVVDDDASILRLMSAMLLEFGFEPVTASSGPEGVASALENPPRLVLLDQHMPGMTGADTIRAFRSNPALAQIPILILSGESLVAGEAALLGANGAIQKPFELADLLSRIRAYTD